MPNLYTIHDDSLDCDIACFISDNDGSASAVLANFALARPAGARQFTLFSISEIQIIDGRYVSFDFANPLYIRTFSEPSEVNNG